MFGGGGISGEGSASELNEGVVEGVAFRGRILLAINTNIIVDKTEILETENAQLEKLTGRTVSLPIAKSHCFLVSCYSPFRSVSLLNFFTSVFF